LTDEMERQAEEYFQRIEEIGGVLNGIENGFFQREIAEASYRYQKELENHQQVMVGVNAFVEEEEERIPILKIAPEVERAQCEEVKRWRNAADRASVVRELENLRAACRDDGAPLMPAIIECVRVGATEGEIARAMKDVFGTWRERPVF
ncbi:MAG: methylmalonyl-CoA mutase family protein, partial [Thermaerobacter sp.]|nr:methylmalonyl-CoA mutase family protein [Thermaerobacter sp.]